MRLSQYFMPILRDDPKEAEIISHRLMLRAGLVRQRQFAAQLAGGIGLPADGDAEVVLSAEDVPALEVPGH